MYAFTLQEKKKALFWLSLFHILIIASSNYLVQLPVTVFGFHATWGAFSFPFIFLATDLTVRIFGAQTARWIVLAAMMPALVISYTVTVLFRDGVWAGWHSLTELNIFVARIALASFSAYLIGQLMDIFVFNKLRQLKAWWVAPAASAVAGNAVDTFAFFSIAFYKTDDEYLSTHLVEIAWVDYAFKVIVCLIFFVPLYGAVLRYLINQLMARRQEIG